jgi:hypothetical protein
VLVCDLRDEHPAGDHTVVIGRVRAVHPLRDGTGLDTVSLRVRGHDPSPGSSNGAPRRPREASSRSTLRYTKTRPARRVEIRPAPCQRPVQRRARTADCLLRASGCSRRGTSVRLLGYLDAEGSHG